MINTEEILAQLDSCNSDYTFPMLDNGYVYPAGTKLTAYRDDKRWVLIIEAIGFHYRAGGHDGMSNCLHVFGNCLNYEPGTHNESFLYPMEDANNESMFDEEESFYINPNCKSFILREHILPLYQDRTLYKNAGIDIEEPDQINAFEFLRLLDYLHHDKLVATEEEIRQRIPADLPKIIELHHWYHPDVAAGDLPSNNETFIQIAEVLATGDLGCYRPTQDPNTHWKNWPEGGVL